jgi:hypothetical protein
VLVRIPQGVWRMRFVSLTNVSQSGHNPSSDTDLQISA